MSKYGANLPSVLVPVGDICVRVYIPNHPDYIKLFVRAIRMLEVNRMYARDENLSAKTVTAQWRDRTITPLIEALATGTGDCGSLDGECLPYPPYADFFSYFPQNPYTEPDLVPPGFLVPPFYINGKDSEHTIPSHKTGDVIANFAAVNLEPAWDLSNTPRIELCIEGSGVAEIHLLNIVQGGAAIISLDNPVDLGDILAGIIGGGIDSIDLNQDIVSLPPETAEEIIIEVEVPTEGEHIIYIYFVPVVNDSLIPLAFGGGIREVSLCGNLRPCGYPAPEPPPPLEGVEELKPEFQFTADCGLEYRLIDHEENIVQDWQPVPGWVDNAALCFAVGGDVATKDDIRDGIYEAMNRLALQLASGGYTNISVDEDGNVSTGGAADGGPELPEDDPTTPIDETQSAKYGAMLEIAGKLELVLDKADAYFGVPSGAVTPATSLADATSAMISYFPCDFMLMTTAMDNYYTWRLAGQTQIVFNGTTALPLYMYCNGYDYNALSRYIIDKSGYIPTKQQIVLKFWESLADSFFSHYYAMGQEKPDSHYLDAPCVPIAFQEFLNVPFASARVTTPFKASHRMKFKISGVSTDPDGDWQDAFWYYKALDQTYTRTNPTFVHSAGGNQPSDNQIVRNAAHVYEYTIDLGALNNVMTITMNKNAGMAAGASNPNFHIEITDLGLAISE